MSNQYPPPPPGGWPQQPPPPSSQNWTGLPPSQGYGPGYGPPPPGYPQQMPPQGYQAPSAHTGWEGSKTLVAAGVGCAILVAIIVIGPFVGCAVCVGAVGSVPTDHGSKHHGHH